MAGDPTIPLQVGQGAAAPRNPLDTLASIMQTNQLMNANRLFQMEFAGRQRLGQIASQSLDDKGQFSPDMFFSNALRDPIAAPFAGPALSSMREAQQAELAMQGQRTQIMGNAWSDLSKQLAASASQPDFGGNTLPAVLKAWQARYPKFVQDQLSGPASDLIKSLTATPDGSPVQPDLVRNRLYELGVPYMSKDELASTFGSPDTQTQASATGVNRPVLGTRLPVSMGSGFQASQPLPQGITPAEANAPVQTVGGGVTTRGQGAPIVTSEGAVVPPGGTGGGAMASPAQTALSTDIYKQGADYKGTLDNKVQEGAQMMKVIQEAQTALQDFKPGGGAQLYAKIGQFAQSIGVPKDMVDKIANGSIAGSQEFNKLMVDTTMARIRANLAGIGGSRINQIEFEHFTENNPNIDTDPQAIQKIFKFWTRMYGIDRDEQGQYTDWLAQGKSPLEWQKNWQQQLIDKYKIAPEDASKATSGMLANKAQPIPLSAKMMLKEGVNTPFKNGQVWTLQNGEPTRVQ